ncbi:hypothetical protein MCC93_15310 [Morococcus cerebrosus]|uniref:Uncharacterized protein n=1 Tax=Morococcus cerebrosus TaxID=1056807 RepID=A0A0C1E4Y3_9NEIS|nr:hypothetical protein MCC93_15310 [Morococcus cerebrosus]
MDKIRMMEKEQVGSLIGTGKDFKRMVRSSEILSVLFFKT